MSDIHNNYNDNLIAVLMDNMFNCKDHMYIIKSLLKLLHTNNAIPERNYKAINSGLIGFISDPNEEEKTYDHFVNNIQHKTGNNNEVNLVKLLAGAYKKFDIPKEVLQTVILSWLVSNREYDSSCKLIGDSNKLYNFMMEYSQKKHGRLMIKQGGEDDDITMIANLFKLTEDGKIEGTIYKKSIIYFLVHELNYDYNRMLRLLSSIDTNVDYGAKTINRTSLVNFETLFLNIILRIHNNNVYVPTLGAPASKQADQDEWDDKIKKIKDNLLSIINKNQPLKDTLKYFYNKYFKNVDEHHNEKFSTFYTNLIENSKKFVASSKNDNDNPVIFGGYNNYLSNNHSYVNNAINKMLIGGRYSHSAYNISFSKLPKLFTQYMENNNLKLEDDDIKRLDELAKILEDTMNIFRSYHVALYIKKYLENLNNNSKFKILYENLENYINKFSKIDKKYNYDKNRYIFDKDLKDFQNSMRILQNGINSGLQLTDSRMVKEIEKLNKEDLKFEKDSEFDKAFIVDKVDKDKKNKYDEAKIFLTNYIKDNHYQTEYNISINIKEFFALNNNYTILKYNLQKISSLLKIFSDKTVDREMTKVDIIKDKNLLTNYYSLIDSLNIYKFIFIKNKFDISKNINLNIYTKNYYHIIKYINDNILTL